MNKRQRKHKSYLIERIGNLSWSLSMNSVTRCRHANHIMCTHLHCNLEVVKWSQSWQMEDMGKTVHLYDISIPSNAICTEWQLEWSAKGAIVASVITCHKEQSISEVKLHEHIFNYMCQIFAGVRTDNLLKSNTNFVTLPVLVDVVGDYSQ
jgi:hypothetical protein